MGLKEGKHFRAFVKKDTDVLGFVQPQSQDIVSCVAQIHHHAYLDTPLKILYDSLEVGGMILIADWHNSMWEHPARVNKALIEDYEWPSKEEDLEAFVRAYPKALKTPPPLNNLDMKTNMMIRKFWISYGQIKYEAILRKEFDERDDILMLEGHRPVERQIEEMEIIGFKTNTIRIREIQDALYLKENPHQLIPHSRILMFTLAEK